MSENNPKYWKFYPTEAWTWTTDDEIFDGDYTRSMNDRIILTSAVDQTQTVYTRNANTLHWGRIVIKKVGGRPKQVWEDGISIAPGTFIDGEHQGEPVPVWLSLEGYIDGVVLVKLPNGEQPEPVET